MVNIQPLMEERIPDFIAFCKENREELDDSFLYDEDLASFKPNEDHPTYIVLNDKSEIIAAVVYGRIKVHSI